MKKEKINVKRITSINEDLYDGMFLEELEQRLETDAIMAGGLLDLVGGENDDICDCNNHNCYCNHYIVECNCNNHNCYIDN